MLSFGLFFGLVYTQVKKCIDTQQSSAELEQLLENREDSVVQIVTSEFARF